MTTSPQFTTHATSNTQLPLRPHVRPEAAEHVVHTFISSDNYAWHYRFWPAADPTQPRSNIIGLHGIQSHSGWYEYSSRRLAQAGHNVWLLDRRGSGLNDKHRGHTAHCDRLINDVLQFATQLKHEMSTFHASTPTVLLAVSWGGKLAVSTANRRPDLFNSLALLYPGLCSRFHPTRLQNFQLNLADAFERHLQRIPIPLDDPCLFTGVREWQEFIRHDPLAIREVSVGFLLANRELDHMSRTALNRIQCPLLLMLAGRDRIIDNLETYRRFVACPSTDKKFIEYGNARHTLEFEPNREEFVDDLLAWCERVCDRRACLL